jgi:DNA-binding NtrC family response regulator
MGKILVIEDDRNIQGLIEKIFPNEGLSVIKAFPRDKEKELAGSGVPNAKSWPAVSWEETIRIFLREEVSKSAWGSIHDDIIGKIEKSLIGIILEEEKGNQVRAAKRLGINRNTLRKRIKDLQITTRVITGYGQI